MKNMVRTFAVACCLLEANLVIAQTNNADNSTFQAFTSQLAIFRATGEPELMISVSGQKFSILRPVSRQITEPKAVQTLRKAEVALPQLRIDRDRETLSYPVDSRTWVERSNKIGDSKNGSWSTRTLEPIATYPRSTWPRFVQFALQNGLSGVTIYQDGNQASGFVYFESSGPNLVTYGTRKLILSPDFYNTMRVSPEYPGFAGTAGFVVLVHDPHSNIVGRYDLMLGLETLFRENQRNFEFLVEGAFPEKPRVDYRLLTNRPLTDGGLRSYLKGISDVDHRPLVYAMLRNYLIDTPLAFRLLHPEVNIPAFAIDDNRFLKEALVNQGTEQSQRIAIVEVMQAAAKSTQIAEKEKEVITTAGFYLLAMQAADLSKVSDVYLAQQKKEAGQIFEVLTSVGSLLAQGKPALKTHVAVLRRAGAAYMNDSKTYENAMLRNETMAPFISAEARKSDSQLPIAFIGSYHTQGITAELRKQRIGYIVIEPRRRLFSNDLARDERRFRSFLADPDKYFENTKLMNKGLAGLTPEQVDAYHKPFLAKRRAELRDGAGQLSSLAASARIKQEPLRTALQSNGSLSDATVEYGGGAGTPPPPNVPQGAFGFFERNGGKGKLVLLHSGDPRWSDQDRYDLLARVRLILPYSTERSQPVVSVTQHYQDRNTGRGFYSVYQPSTRRIYLVEADAPRIASLVTLPETKTKQEFRMHLQLGEMQPGLWEQKENGNTTETNTYLRD